MFDFAAAARAGTAFCRCDPCTAGAATGVDGCPWACCTPGTGEAGERRCDGGDDGGGGDVGDDPPRPSSCRMRSALFASSAGTVMPEKRDLARESSRGGLGPAPLGTSLLGLRSGFDI